MNHVLDTLKALADGNRLRVVKALRENPELCVCEITKMLGVSTPTVSRHMSILRKSGLVQSRKDGRWVYYRLSKEASAELLKWLDLELSSSEVIAKDREKIRRILGGSSRSLDRSGIRLRSRGVKRTRRVLTT